MGLMMGDVAAMLLAAISFVSPMQRRTRERARASSTRQNECQTLGKLDGKLDFADFPNTITCYAARLSSPHAYIMLSQRGACGRTLGGSAPSELDTQCRIRDNP